MNLIKSHLSRLKKRVVQSRLWIAATLFIANYSLAQLPAPQEPTRGGNNDNYLQFMQGWTADAIDYVALAISGVGFLWAAWILLSKFNEARTSKDPDWGSVGLTAVVAGVLLVVVSYFLNETTGIFGAAAP